MGILLSTVNQELINYTWGQRAIKNITKKGLAVQIKVLQETIITIETGKIAPSTILTIKLARFFGISVHDLFPLVKKYNNLWLILLGSLLLPE
jgi:putative transcriptional regulator